MWMSARRIWRIAGWGMLRARILLVSVQLFQGYLFAKCRKFFVASSHCIPLSFSFERRKATTELHFFLISSSKTGGVFVLFVPTLFSRRFLRMCLPVWFQTAGARLQSVQGWAIAPTHAIAITRKSDWRRCSCLFSGTSRWSWNILHFPALFITSFFPCQTSTSVPTRQPSAMSMQSVTICRAHINASVDRDTMEMEILAGVRRNERRMNLDRLK